MHERWVYCVGRSEILPDNDIANRIDTIGTILISLILPYDRDETANNINVVDSGTKNLRPILIFIPKF